MNNVKHAVLVLASLCALGLSACKGDEAGAVHDADWYLANSKALQAKLKECKVDVEAAKTDANCKAATDAFLRWYAASGLAARQADAEGSSLDNRLSAPAPAAAESSATGTESAIDPAAAPATPNPDKPQDQPATPPSN